MGAPSVSNPATPGPASATPQTYMLVIAVAQGSGPLDINSLPTTLPAQAGVLWNNGGVLSIS